MSTAVLSLHYLMIFEVVCLGRCRVAQQVSSLKLSIANVSHMFNLISVYLFIMASSFVI